MRRITVNSFRNSGMRGVGYGECWKGMRPGSDLKSIKSLGANHIRLWLQASLIDGVYQLGSAQTETLYDYLSACAQLNLYVIPVLSFADRDQPWKVPGGPESITALWKSLAKMLQPWDVVAGFDLFNEPTIQALPHWNSWVDKTVKAIWEEDWRRVPIIEFCPDAHPNYAKPEPFNVLSNVVYSIHSYNPHTFTHANVDGAESYSSPSQAYSESVLQSLHASLLPTLALAEKHKLAIYAGEFSANVRNVGVVEYIRHSIKLFHGFGWSWNYHMWRAAPEWNAESLPHSSVQELRSAFKRK